MVKASSGSRCRTRSVMRKSPRDKGMPPITRTFQTFEMGDKVSIILDSSEHGGQPHPRFQGVTGTVMGMQGRAYVVDIRAGKKTKKIIASPEHLRKSE